MSRYDMYLSYSGFKKYVECPQSYYLEYIERKRPKVEDQRNTLNGNSLHNLLEAYLKQGENDTAWLIKNGSDYWDDTLDSCAHVVWRHDTDAADLKAKYSGWVTNLANLFDEKKFDVTKCEPELKADTVVNVGGTRLKMGGRLDVVMKTQYNSYMFFDLKASENRAVMEFDQLVWYSVILGEYLKNPEEPKIAGYILPGFNEIRTYQVPVEAKKKLVARLQKVIGQIQNEEWTPKPEDKKCWWCPVKYVCPVKGKLIPHGSGTIYLGDS